VDRHLMSIRNEERNSSKAIVGDIKYKGTVKLKYMLNTCKCIE